MKFVIFGAACKELEFNTSNLSDRCFHQHAWEKGRKLQTFVFFHLHVEGKKMKGSVI